MRSTNNVTFLEQPRKGIKRKIIAYPAIIGKVAQTIQTGVTTKKWTSGCVQILSYNMRFVHQDGEAVGYCVYLQVLEETKI
jgi:hypothetical protein